MWHRCLYKSKPCTTTTTAPPPPPPPERERERERCQRWRPSSSITLIFHNNMKNSVHRRGLMNCIFRVTLAFLMKLDESPQAGQLCLNWCWLCQGTSMATPLRETQTFHRLINLPFALSDNFSKNMWFKVWHLSQSDPGTLHPPAAPRHPSSLLFCSSYLEWTRLLSAESTRRRFCDIHPQSGRRRRGEIWQRRIVSPDRLLKSLQIKTWRGGVAYNGML